MPQKNIQKNINKKKNKEMNSCFCTKCTKANIQKPKRSKLEKLTRGKE